jgi:hypothetical protein
VAASGANLVEAAARCAGARHEEAEARGTAFQGFEYIVVNSFNFIDQQSGRRIWLVVDTFDISPGIGGAAEEKAALSVADFGFEPGPADESWAEAEAAQGSKELIFDLGAGSRKVHKAAARVVVQRPQSADWKNYRCFTGEIGAGRGRLEAGFVIKQDLALPIVGLDAEDGIDKEQDGNFGSGNFAVWARHSGW